MEAPKNLQETEYSLRYDLLPIGEQHTTTASSTFNIRAFPFARTKQKSLPQISLKEAGIKKAATYSPACAVPSA